MRKIIPATIILIIFVTSVILSTSVHAQRRDIPKKTDGSQTASSRTAPTQATQATDAKSKVTGANMSERQKGNVKQLESDLGGIKQGSQVTPQQKDNLKNSLMAMADGATKPDPAAVQKLANDLSEAVADGRLSANERYKLSEDLEAVMNSANISEAEVDKAIADAQAILIASGVDKSDVQTVVYDMKQIGAEGKKNAQSAATEGKKKVQGMKRKQ